MNDSHRTLRNVAFGAALCALAASAGYLGWAMGQPAPPTSTVQAGAQELPSILSDFNFESLDGESIGMAHPSAPDPSSRTLDVRAWDEVRLLRAVIEGDR